MSGEMRQRKTWKLNSVFCSKAEFKNAIEKITKMKISERENNFLFNMVDANKDGVIDVEDELKLNMEKHIPTV